MTQQEMQEEVKNAALYLDKNHPGWFYQVNKDELEMGSCIKCIIGQVFGIEFGNDAEWGFIISKIFGDPNNFGLEWDYPKSIEILGFSARVFAFTDLEPYWKQEIQERLNEANQSKQRIDGLPLQSRTTILDKV